MTEPCRHEWNTARMETADMKHSRRIAVVGYCIHCLHSRESYLESEVARLSAELDDLKQAYKDLKENSYTD